MPFIKPLNKKPFKVFDRAAFAVVVFFFEMIAEVFALADWGSADSDLAADWL